MSASSRFQSRRFEILRELGAGGMGVVYDAVDRETGERVAIKTVQHLDPSSLLRFKREFRSLADVNHPNLVRLGELYEEDGRWFFTMELVHGVDIVEYVSGVPSVTSRVTHRRSTSGPDAAITEEAPLEPSDVPIDLDYQGSDTEPTWIDPVEPLDLPAETDGLLSSRGYSDSWGTSEDSEHLTTVARPKGSGRSHAIPRRAARTGPPDMGRLTVSIEQLVGAVLALHSAGQVHRDVKPSNVLVTVEGRVVLLDMGIAAAVDPDRGGRMDRVAGTAAFMAPEQIDGRASGPEADWYAVGVVLYEALTGTLPFRGSRQHVLEAKQHVRPVEPRTFEPSVPEALEQLCMDLLTIDPGHRLDGHGILARLSAMTRSVGVADSIPPPPGTPSVPFVGRTEELRALRHRLVDVQLGTAAKILLAGEPGIGKSTLASRFLRWLRRSHPEALVLQGRCYQQEAVPFKAFDGLVDTLTLALEAMPREERHALLAPGVEDLALLFPVLRRVLPRHLPEPRHPVNRGETRRRAFEAMRQLMLALSERSLLVLFIDDIQWSDVESFALLQEVLAPPVPPPLMVIATARADFLASMDAGHQSPLAAGTLWDFERIGIGDLSPDEARALALEILGPAKVGLDLGLVDQVVSQAHGHPLFLHELLRHPGTGEGPGLGMRLEDVLWARVADLAPEPQIALRVVSVAGFPLPRDLLAEMAGLRRRDCAAALRTLRSELLVRISTHAGEHTVEPYHDRVRESVEAHLDPEEAELIHARVADVMMRYKLHHDDPLALVHHLERAGQRERAGRQALSAAERLTGGLAFELVARLYEEAIRLTSPEEDALARIHLRIGDAYRSGGRARDAARWYLLGAKSHDLRVRRTCRRQAAELLILCGDIERGTRELRAVLSDLGLRQPPRWLMAAAIPLRERSLLRRGLASMPAESLATDADREQLDAQAVAWRALHMVDPITTAYHLYAHAARARDLGEVSRAVESFVFALLAYVTTHGAEGREAIEPLREGLRERAALLPESTRNWVQACDSCVLGMTGNPYEMTAALREMEAWYQVQEERDPMRLILLRATFLESLRTIGAVAELMDYHERMLREARRTGDLMLEALVVRTTNIVWLMRDDPSRAESELDRPLWTPPEAGFHIQHLYELRARCEIDMYRGATEDLRRRHARGFRQASLSMMSLLQAFALELAFLEGRVLLAQDDGRGDAPTLSRKLKKLAGKIDVAGDPQHRVRAEILRAGAAAAVGDRELAATRCREIVRVADASHLAIEAACARIRLGTIGSRPGEQAMAEGTVEWMRNEGAIRPERLVDIVMPGFRRLTRAI